MSETRGIDLSLVRSRVFSITGATGGSEWYVAYSGGVDSTVLLHILGNIARDAGIRLVALHADHGLQDRSPDWRRHCEWQCGEWNIECRSSRLAWDPGRGAGPEAGAREARYRWFREMVGGECWLFTAHHRGDQAETVIERLARGSGPRGLRGMLPAARIYGVNVARPLLDVGRAEVEAYAKLHRLRWLDDDSNRDVRFTRNYIRGRVLPDLKRRWPGIESALARTAGAMREAQSLLDQTAASDLVRLDARLLGGEPSLRIPALKTLGAERQRNVLRHWIQRELGIPLGLDRLNRAVSELARYPSKPGGLRWLPVDLRMHRDRLYLAWPEETPRAPRPWSLEGELVLTERIVLTARRATGRGLRADMLPESVMVGFRRGGERCRLPGRERHQKLKNLLQDAGIPPWQRPRIPLILVRDEVAAVAGVACCSPFAARPGEPGIDIEITYAPPAPRM